MRQILSEIDHPRKTFKRAAPTAVGILCVLYMLVNISYVRNSLVPVSYWSSKMTFADDCCQKRRPDRTKR